MNKRFMSAMLSLSVAATMCSGFAVTAQAAEAKTPTYQTTARQMEDLSRGLIAVKTTASDANGIEGGVYLSWRLLGTESLENQAFDIYKNDVKIYTTGTHDATCYTDTTGTAADTYKVVKAGASATEVAAETAATPITTTGQANDSLVNDGTSEKNAFAYIDVPIQIPDDVSRMGDGKTSTYKRGSDGNGANDASVGDLDGDGDYEIVLKWDPADSKDSAGADYTGNVYIDGYEITTDTDNLMWRIDLGQNVTAGAHYTQFMVYDLDGDGKSEVAMKTAPGSIDGTGHYVSEVGDSAEIRNVDNTKSYIGTSGGSKGKNLGPEYLTIFDGETGAAMYTTDFIPLGTSSEWGDSKYNRAERFLAGIAYLDGVHPSLIMCRGYYAKAVVRAYSWDGDALNMTWEYNSGQTSGSSSLYGQGNHNLSIGDIDDDGYDEIVYGSAALDHDGKTVLGNTQLGHGDAIHMSDFNNDGVQEVFSVKEDQYKKYAEDLRVASTGTHFWSSGKIVTDDDNGRGVMDNIDDAYASTHENALSIGWSSGIATAHDLNGDKICDATYTTKTNSSGESYQVQQSGKPLTSSRSMTNFLVYWDGDLGRELLDDNQVTKYYADTGYTVRFYSGKYGYWEGSSNNSSKYTPALVADIFGDWREEIIMPITNSDSVDTHLRIYTSTLPTNYRLTTLMHDSQYRCSVAWQNVAYNQPTHTSYYVGSAALATDSSGNTLNYLAPAVAYTNVAYSIDKTAVTGITLSDTTAEVEKGKTIAINANVAPADATKKSVTWTSSDTSVATVSNGVVKGVSEGTATITATTKDGGFTASCEVTVKSNHVRGITLSDKLIEIGIDNTSKLTATVYPSNASDPSVVWESSDSAVATVSENGTVTGVSYGKATITATTVDGGYTAKCIVKVKPIEMVDATGEDVFTSTTDTDTFTGTATGGSLDQSQVTTASEFHKNFTPYSKNIATLSLNLNSGGQKEGSSYIWKLGHEYNSGLRLLDTEGNTIFDIYDVHANSSSGTGVTTMYKLATGDAKNVSTWNKTAEGDNSPLGRSQIRWNLTAEFDYNNDTCTVTLAGCDSSWVAGETYQTSFSLNGASFKTLQYYTADIADYVTVKPSLSNVSYGYKTTISGNTELIYEKGTDDAEWTESDLTDWTQTGTETAELAVDSENNRISYNPTKPATPEYNASKTFELDDNAIVTYDVDWYFGKATGRDSVLEYIQFGDKLRIGWTSGYVTWVSKDGGETWDDNDGDGTTDSIFNGANETYTKNIKLIVDTSTNTIKSLTFDGKTIDAYTDTVIDGAKFDSVTFGLQRGGGTSDWEYPNGIDRIRVSQFVEGEEAPDFSEVTIDGIDSNNSKKANISYVALDCDESSALVIGALYDKDGVLKETATKNITLNTPVDNIRRGTSDIEFENNISGYTLKVFIWDTLDGMKPICDSDELK